MKLSSVGLFLHLTDPANTVIKQIYKFYSALAQQMSDETNIFDAECELRMCFIQ